MAITDILYYPLLSKFERLKAVDFFTKDGTGANDEKLQALANLKLDKDAGPDPAYMTLLPDDGSVWFPKNQPLSDHIVDVKQFVLPAENTMVPSLRLDPVPK